MRERCIVLLTVVQTKPNWCLGGCGCERFRVNSHKWDHGFPVFGTNWVRLTLFIVFIRTPTNKPLEFVSYSVILFSLALRSWDIRPRLSTLFGKRFRCDNWKSTKCAFCETLPRKPWLRRSLRGCYIKILGTISSLKNHSWKSGFLRV